MKQFDSEHYCFHYGENTQAERDIVSIAVYQEACFSYICSVLKVSAPFKIQYFLCDSPEEVGELYGDHEPCNGFASLPDTIYAVYNEQVRCIGFHEDVHILSEIIHHPESPAIREGLAMYFDRKWWGISNLDWVRYDLKTGCGIPVDKLLDPETFFAGDCSITYPTMGAFTEYLIFTYGIQKYLAFYRQKDMESAWEAVFQKPAAKLSREFAEYVKMFPLDRMVENRIRQLRNG